MLDTDLIDAGLLQERRRRRLFDGDLTLMRLFKGGKGSHVGLEIGPLKSGVVVHMLASTRYTVSSSNGDGSTVLTGRLWWLIGK